MAVGLAFTHQALGEKQTQNINIDKMQQVLRSLKIDEPANTTESKYKELIKNAYLIRTDGSVIDGSEGITPTDPAFSTDIADNTAEGLPVFEAELNGDKYYIIPMSGKGLWGPVWGYLSIGSDGSTIYGSEFGHAGETPGLGAEIVNLSFRRQFEGKALIKNNEYKSVAVVKPGNTLADKDYVDGISGGTITSNGVNAMLYESVGLYKDFLLKLNAAQ